MPLHSPALHAFIAVAEELHFGNAAKRLHISQPPLSQQIRRFEKEIGIALFIRSTRSVELTPAGLVLLTKARQLIEDGEAALLTMHRTAQGDMGKLTIGFTSTAAYQVLPKLLASYHKNHPDIALTLVEDLSTNLIQMVESQKVDIALLRKPLAEPPASLIFQRVSQENMCVALPNTHPLAAQSEVWMQQLHGIAFIGFNAQAALYFRERLQDLFANFKIQPNIVHESVMPTLLALVEAGIGAAIVPESASSLRPDGVSYRPLADAANVAAIDLYCAHRRDEHNPAMQTLAKNLDAISQ